MSIIRNPVQVFVRNAVRLVVFLPLWLLFALRNFTSFINYADPVALIWGVVKTFIIFWVAILLAKLFFSLPVLERLVLLRLG
ncbi:MAG: hypothetical protein ACK2T7_12920 [Anaerolineales bacterium]